MGIKILHISISNADGGAAIAAYRLHKAMQANGLNSKILVAFDNGRGKTVDYTISKTQSVMQRGLCRLSASFKKRFLKIPYTFSFAYLGIRISTLPAFEEADVIYIHWINNDFLNIDELSRILSLRKPVIFFMHDMWAITGGCHHSFSCNQYMSKCEVCPNIPNIFFKNIVSSVFKRKSICFSHKNIAAIVPSNWLYTCVKHSTLFANILVKRIPNTLDTNIFRKYDRGLARKELNFPQEKKLILFGANGGSSNPYKGWRFLVEALTLLKQEDIEIVLLGNKLTDNEKKYISFNVHSVGRVVDENSLALLYSAVDVFVSPSLADNFPNTILEAISCGTLVVGFDVGGIPDLVKHYKTGYLAKYMNSSDLAHGISWAIKHSCDDELSVECQEYIKNNCSEQVVVEEHSRFLKELMKKEK